jgi:Predicted sugar phosphatases of the HAD superfamily
MRGGVGGAPLLATSTAPVFSVAGRVAAGWSGAVVAGIEHTTGARALTLGKPSPIALDEMCRALGTSADRTLVVGDDLDLEIEMARGRRAHGPGVTGISSAADVDARSPELRPSAVLPAVSHLLTSAE